MVVYVLFDIFRHVLYKLFDRSLDLHIQGDLFKLVAARLRELPALLRGGLVLVIGSMLWLLTLNLLFLNFDLDVLVVNLYELRHVFLEVVEHATHVCGRIELEGACLELVQSD